MKFRVVILSVFCSLLFYRSVAQDAGNYTQPRILFLVDESSSMLQQWSNGRPKHKMANEIINKLMDSVIAVNGNVQFSLRVFGNQHTVPEHDCTDTRSEVPFSPDNRTQMSFRLEDMHPLGVTAIAYSLSEAAEHDLVDEAHYAYSIILITDGGESCNGDICGVMDKLIRNKVFFKPYVLSLEDEPQLKAEYACLGSYLSVTKQADISKAVNKIVDAFRPMLTITKADYQKMQVIASKAPSALKVVTPPVKTEVPVEDKPKPKAVDTVKEVPPVKKTSIVVGEEPKLPAPVTMKKIPVPAFTKMFVARASPKTPALLDVPSLDIKVAEEDIIVPHPGPLTIAKVATPKYKITPVPHVTFGGMPLAPTVPLEIKTDPLPVVLTPLKMEKVKTVALKKLPVAKADAFIPYKAAEVKLEVKTEMPPAAIKMESIATTGLTKLKTSAPEPAAPKKVAEKPLVINTTPPAPEVVKSPPVKLPKIKGGTFRMHLLYVNTFLDSDLKPLKLPPLVINTALPTPEPAKPATTTPAKPGKPTTPAKPAGTPKTGEYTVEHEDAKETTLEVYFTNGKGKFYSSTPRVFLQDPATNKEVKRFFRTVDASGNPDPVTNLATGKYNLTVAGRDDLLAHVEIEPNKRNKVYVKVKPYSLFFYYPDAPNRPVKEFVAEVIQRNVDNGKITMQKCSDRMEYEPGNYHIRINTFPEDIRNMDLDDVTAGGIAIPQPGFVKFSTELKTNTVDLFRELGDKYVQFATINLADPKAQHLQIQPGKYQAHYSNGTSKFAASVRVLPFQVFSTKETEVILVLNP